MGQTSNLTIESLFNSGRFQDVLAQFESLPPVNKNKNQTNWALWIGALVFLGQTEKAFSIYNLKTEKKQLSIEEQVACRFFLIIGAVRTSQYPLAQKLIIDNLRSPKASSKKIQFYQFQGLAFYRFFCGRLSLSKKYAKKAFDAAVKSHFRFGEMISTDLLGHSLVSLGSVREGLKHLESALSLAQQNKNTWLSGAIQITIAKFRAQHGIDPIKDLQHLETALQAQSPTDTYSRAELLLELNRQYVLRGFFTQAEQLIAEASDLAYKHQNRRQIATLNLRMSYMLFLQRNFSQSLHILRFAEQNLDAKTDRGLYLQMQGLKANIMLSSNKYEDFNATMSLLKQETVKSQNAINRRIIHRLTSSERNTVARGEDPLGDLIDATVSQSPHALNDILKYKYYGLFHKYFKLPFQSKAIIVDLVPGSIVLINSGNVIFKEKGLNSLLRKILLLSRQNSQSKETLLQQIWGYKYDPLRHDPLIYSSVNKLRKLLHPYGAWFHLTENGYRVRPDVKVLFKNSLEKNKPLNKNSTPLKIETTHEKVSTVAIEHLSSLNFRQIQIINYLKKNLAISISEVAETMSISKPTATRDLSHLHQLKIVDRVGQGRATKYLLKPQTSSLHKGQF